MWAEGPAEIDLFSDRFGLPIVLGTRSRRFPSAKTWGRLRRTSIRGHTRRGLPLEIPGGGAGGGGTRDAHRPLRHLPRRARAGGSPPLPEGPLASLGRGMEFGAPLRSRHHAQAVRTKGYP